MITIDYLISRLGFFDNKKLSKETIDLLSTSIKLIEVEYDKSIAINEFKIHKKYLDKAGVKYFGINELIDMLMRISDEKILIINCHNENHVLKVFMDLNHNVIGVVGFEKRKRTPEEIEREMHNLRRK
ncbi:MULTISPECIES: hypothetical protein [unclassified Serratia (in: enterobacteria)]|uniref:hypothetical protein n=1 Tax=unclassified Serratia (in: enterobacteria) TaxID=2647522 RepID=UPI001CC128A5|nr:MULTISPECIES: hypothetical protein [unclassified Serratia (in: enterobacteria)]UAN57666.1 hypothetical protein KGP21_00765 [Serratia sp. JSRIV004]UAN63127.1 hypothetical protein KGP16_00520 [Serratia sp. JSRIV006]